MANTSVWAKPDEGEIPYYLRSPETDQPQVWAQPQASASQTPAPVAPKPPGVDLHAGLTPLWAPPPEVKLDPDPLHQQEGHMQNKLNQDYQKDANPWGTPQNHPGILGKIGHGLNVARNIAETVFAPTVAAADPTSSFHRSLEERGLQSGIQSLQGQESQNAYRGAETAKTQATTPTDAERQAGLEHTRAETGLENAQAEGARNPWAKQPGNEPVANIDQLNKAMLSRYRVLNPEAQALPPEFSLPPNATKNDFDRLDKLMTATETASGNRDTKEQSNKIREAMLSLAQSNAGEKNLWSVPQPDGSKKVVQLKPGDTVPQGAVSLAGQNTESVAQGKPTADEQRRADLSENLNENLTALEEIVRRRPQMFGPLAGRWSELRGKFGSDDPDIAALQTIEHQLGMAQISAHGMRSAQGIQNAADSIMNHMHSGPNGILSAIQAARNSVSTFTGDVNKKTGGGQQDSGDIVYDDKGVGHRYKGTGNRADPNSYEAVK